MSKAKKLHPYYNYAKVWSFNAVINLIVGGRGLGKTYGAKKKGIIDAIKRGEEFVYLRRYMEELKAAKSTFFADIENEFPGHEFRLWGMRGQMSESMVQSDTETDAEFSKRKRSRKWQTVCYFVALSVAQSQKSVAFPKVTLIVFDEFIIEKSANNSYLRDEVTAFLNFYNTVDRNQDKTRCLLLANSVSIMNPYFSTFDIEPDKMPEIGTKDDGFILWHFPDSESFAKSIYNTRFGRFIAGSEYADYAVGNEFKDAHDKLVSEKTSSAKYKYTLETRSGAFSVWFELSTGVYYVLSRRPGNERILTMNADSMAKNKILVSYTEPVIRSLRSAFNRGKVEFDKPATRNAFAPIFERK